MCRRRTRQDARMRAGRRNVRITHPDKALFPGGITRPGFFAKEVPKGAPEWVPTIEVPKKGGTVRHVLANETATLVWLANQNCITPHVSTARADRLDRPDRIVWDLDPSGDDFDLVRRTAIDLGALIREAGCEPFAMVTGSRGIHVVVAIRRRYAYGAVRDALERLERDGDPWADIAGAAGALPRAG